MKIFRGKRSNSIAKERLKLMLETSPLDDNSQIISQANQEIKQIINKYFDIDSNDYEIKVLLKQIQKRAKNVKTI
ncbi:MAG: cell division topological specificity factor MinE [Agathobacter sp.]|nr:cell division topological specificity factor MinE [Agathobacter sp.]